MQRDASGPQGNSFRAALTPRRWGEYLIAILGGNIIYLFIEPELPTIMRHRMFRIDLGLGIDFLICVAAYGVVRQFSGHGEPHG